MLVFLFTDIEGSSQLWEEHTGRMTGVIARHDEILREAVEGHGGRITKHTGDGITAVFEAGQPLACALEAQVRKNLLWAGTQRHPGVQRTRLEFAAS